MYHNDELTIDGPKEVTIKGVKWYSPVVIRGIGDLRWLEFAEFPEVYGAGGVYLPMSKEPFVDEEAT